MNILFFDTETTGKYDFKLPPDHPSQPYLVQLGAILTDDNGKERAGINVLIKPDGWTISQEVVAIHGITEEIAYSCGVNIKTAAFLFNNLCYQADLLVAHNLDFDKNIMTSVFMRNQMGHRMSKMNKYCTMRSATPVLKIPRQQGQSTSSHAYKWPTLSECVRFFFNEEHAGAHDAMNDVVACARVYQELRDRGV